MTMLLDHETYLRRAIEVAKRARENGNHPFGALLVSQRGEVLLEAENTVVTERDVTGHAETNLVRNASKRFDKGVLETSMLYTSTEPCAMCSGAIYWSGISKVVYALSEEGLLELTGSNVENPTMHLPCRDVFKSGQRPIEVIGPMLGEEAKRVHEGFWR
jgi:tRNA(Arg) A34 adenosine deaminase TadA